MNQDKAFKIHKNQNEIKSIIATQNNDLKNENANMNGNTPSGQMMKFASITSKEFALTNVVDKKFAQLHEQGLIHIHDLDFYITKSATCVQYDLEELFEKGFKTRNGFIKTPKSIGVYAELAAIVFQTAQNEMHGGQAIPAFDYFMAPGVNKSFLKIFIRLIKDFHELTNSKFSFEEQLDELIEKHCFNFDTSKEIKEKFQKDLISKKIVANEKLFNKIVEISERHLEKETMQAMEGFIYNLNTQHSRGGNQVVFSSINLGTDSRKSGRLVTFMLLEALNNGLGNGETSIFPIVIFKVKEEVNYDEADVQRAFGLSQSQWSEVNDWKTPNFDLFLKAIETTSRRLFPNFMFLDTPFNFHELWNINDPQKWKYEPATMGCRTRTFENVNGEKTPLGRGNISFTSINLPFLALEYLQEHNLLKNEKINYQEIDQEKIKNDYLKIVENNAQIVAEQLWERFNYQITAQAKQFPFLMQNNILKGGSKLKPSDNVATVFSQGTLTLGFVGLAEALKALTGSHHGESPSAQEFGLKIIETINQVATQWKRAKNLNFGVIGTPAESVAGRMAKITAKKFGIIENVTSREYFTNSNHVPVYYNIKAIDKIKIEAKYHPLTLGGSISYIELDGEARKNLHAVLGIIKAMKDNEINYGSLNHPVDRCKNCNYSSLIRLACPNCASLEISRTRRITGYLVGDLDGWNSGKQAEERERVKHKLNNENSKNF
ncbi:anaerobic ribonucleoside-triphosphate reductase [Spiroplasma sabaudiense Ar-1343]|uniref:Anaerobic ribonucleoside-triphosphate reductase n=1 Tax=Spiroplasma sabaudiense Ar-1343 TaxID=1276257 RepID=W6AJW3_9MOLU|nr:anaerobic ribonucleoside triphosphate reductase [Spiroplasma sabaudiense]AHI54019.1 anaerobic ribonucleoside-triphosphate reductase [Spiroplasma sabaudiense Ar-1343]